MNRRNFLQLALIGGARSPSALAAITTPAKPPTSPDAPFTVRSDITPYVSDFIARTQYSDLDPAAIELGKKSILDAFGLALVGAKSAGGKKLRTYFQSIGGSPANARVLGTSLKLPLRFAAFANGVSIHMEDYDDTQLALTSDRVYGQLTHPTAPAFPVALGLADQLGASGKDFILSYQVGVEVECKLAEACWPRAYKNGFHSTGTFGVFGSTAAGAKLKGFDAALIGQALAIAGSQASGLAQNFGTLMKPFHAGHAAEAGVVAIDLAALGWDGDKNILEAQNGFFHAYGGGYDPELLLGHLGSPWTFVNPGVSIKPYPSGSLTHPGMTEMARLIKEHNIRPENVEHVDVGTNSQMPKSLHNHEPKKGLEAKFSMEYCMAVLLVRGHAGLAEFTDQVVSGADMQAMMRRVRFYTDPLAEAAGYSKMTTLIRVQLKDGQVFTGQADWAKGSPANPMSYEEVAEKFRACADYVDWDPRRAAQVIEGVRKLESLPKISELVDLCV